MDKKIDKIVGLKKSEFDLFIEKKSISLREARLIPSIKIGDEMALTSVILSSIRLIKEFRKMILSAAKMMTGGKIYVYTEVGFDEFKDSRIDGLIIIVKSGIIKDAALLEMKNGTDELEKEQIEKYIKIAKNYNVPRLITISNQYVSEPSQFPINIKPPKSINLYHYSWSFLLTLAHILLFDNDLNIEDEDQVEIMKEVVYYLENDKSGVSGFTQMKQGWKEVVEKINSGTSIKKTDPDLDEAVISWQQEEKDMALILSKNLGIFVNSGDSKYKNNLQGRINNDKTTLLEKKRLTSSLKVKGAISDIRINARFDKRIIEMSVDLKAPQDKKIRGQMGWIKKQIENCYKKNQSEYEKIAKEIFIDVSLKNMSKNERITVANIDSFYTDFKDKEVKEFKLIFIKDFGKQFSSRKNFVKIIEEMLIDFYTGIVQHLSKYEQPAPKIIEKKEIFNTEIIPEQNEISLADRNITNKDIIV